MSNISLIDHIGIAVTSIENMRSFYESSLGLTINHIEELPERGLSIAFIHIGESRIELIAPMHDHSEISKFLQTKGPGIHHIALKTSDIKTSEDNLKNNGCVLLYGEAKNGAHQSLVNFIHPKSSGGVLIELVSHRY